MLIHSPEHLAETLTLHHVDISSWGNGSSKSIDDLYTEITQGESRLEKSDNHILRVVGVATADVLYPASDTILRLVEDKQVYANGSVKIRTREDGSPMGISEKLKSQEDPSEAIIRGIREELQITGNLLSTPIALQIIEEPSSAYPTLLTKYIKHHFLVMLTQSQFRPTYCEQQVSKQTFFSWKPYHLL